MQKANYVFTKNRHLPNDESVQVMRSWEGFDAPIHRHDFIEIIFIEEGTGFHHLNGDKIKVQKGDIFMVPLGVEHVLRPSSIRDGQPLVIFNVLLTVDRLKKLLQETKQLNDVDFTHWLFENIWRQSDHYLHVKDHQMNCLSIVRSMFWEKQNQSIGTNVMLDIKLKELFIHLARLDSYIPSNDVNYKFYQIDMEEIVSYIGEHYNEPLTISNIAQLAHVSERHFSRIFKKQMNQSFTQYLQTIRIEKSCELLVNTSLTVTEICDRVGYKNTDFFRSLFYKKLGLTPSAYRKRLLLSV
ncbi:AraC family transcriptional regulator [Gracilibacillus sp. YIM 98692]|uniref:AraC family transcriptional regulator n=1 Tax=Gracilibacillus sp. YIM 98692 TaxID=2663532 RepID=UPI0013D1DDBF|nr:AraC family transcriptional regulator [Gracilibacillus sp. YIM 98692]